MQTFVEPAIKPLLMSGMQAYTARMVFNANLVTILILKPQKQIPSPSSAVIAIKSEETRTRMALTPTQVWSAAIVTCTPAQE